MRPYERLQADRTVADKIGEASARPLTGRMVLLSLLAFFAIVIGVNGVMIALAIGTMPGLESEKPYQAGITYNAEIETARAQAARHWSVASHVNRDAGGHVSMKIEPRDADGAPIGGLTMTVRLMRPTDQRADRVLSLNEREPGTYLGEAANVLPGVWEVELEATRASKRLFRSHNRITFQ
jgi:nitrogen fixation protein FixH